MNSQTIAVNSNNSPGITLTLESTGIFLGILISISALAGVAVNIISKINRISFSINEIEEASKTNASNTEKIKDLDKRFDIHLQDYINYKDAMLLDRNGLRERIDHKWQRTEDELAKDRAEIKDLREFLVKSLNFKIRD